MGKPTKIFIVLLGIILLFTVISRSAASFTVAQVRIEQPQARKIEHKVTGDGTVKKLLDQAVYAPADILVAKVNVRKGQNVKKGQTLASTIWSLSTAKPKRWKSRFLTMAQNGNTSRVQQTVCCHSARNCCMEQRSPR